MEEYIYIGRKEGKILKEVRKENTLKGRKERKYIEGKKEGKYI